MSQRSSVESPQQSTSTELTPAIQSVLGCLDVNLETEMSQYRRLRKRSQQWVTPSTSVTGQPQYHSIELIDPTAGSQSQLHQSASSAQKLPEFAYAETVGPSLPIAIAPEQGAIEVSKTHQPVASANRPSAPDGYLESSEALIKSLDEQKLPAQPESNLTAPLFTPLGISSMLLFLLSCITLGFVGINSSGLKTLGLDRLFRQSPAATAKKSLSNENPPELPKAPNLASKEFLELDLSTLSNINSRPVPVPTPSVKASLPPTPKPIPLENFPGPNLPDTSKSATNEQSLNNLSTALLPSSSPSPVKPQTALTTIPGSPMKAEDGFYYVVIDFNGEQSLEQAKKAVPDAYARKFPNGVKIQMGAVSDPASAKRLVKELQEKGVPAKYYQP